MLEGRDPAGHLPRGPFTGIAPDTFTWPGHASRDEDATWRADRFPPSPPGGALTYLIVGLDRQTLARWHENVLAGDVGTATRIARARAAIQGITLVVAAVIGPYSSVLPDPADETATASKAA